MTIDLPNGRHRAVWISDLHLGARSCRAGDLLEFLEAVSPEVLYLVGDIVDLWQLRWRVWWPETHNAVLRRIVELAHTGTRVVYIPGNHDSMLRAHADNLLAGVEVRRRAIHRLADGRRLLVVHGDEFDSRMRRPWWKAHAGDLAYDLLLGLDLLCSWFRRRLSLRHWSLAGFVKRHAARAVGIVGAYERIAAGCARLLRFDGIVCGHIHVPALKEIEGVLYLNDGDWVESCTALAEDAAGTLRLLAWRPGEGVSVLAHSAPRAALPAPAPARRTTAPARRRRAGEPVA